MPILSMTGFGVADRVWTERGLRVWVELRSVNARYLELKIRQPFGVAVEHQLRRALEARIGRGRVELSIRVDGAGGGDGTHPLEALGIEHGKLLTVLEALRSLTDEAHRASFQVSHPNSMELLRFLMSANVERGPVERFDAPPFLDALVDEATTKLVEMRTTEGRALAEVLTSALAELEAQVARIRDSLDGEAERLFAQLVARAQAVLARLDLSAVGTIERDRVEHELALLLTRGDVSEELARIASHLDQARATLAATPEPGQGKTLDFLSQELLREVTTIGSKVSSHTGSAVVIEAKRSIERIREQVQNVE